MAWLSAASDIATVFLAIVAVGAYAWYQLDMIRKRRRLESFLKREGPGKRSKSDPGHRSVLFLASQLRMTEDEVLQAGFRSRKLKCATGFDKDTHRPDVIFFEYDHEKAN